MVVSEGDGHKVFSMTDRNYDSNYFFRLDKVDSASDAIRALKTSETGSIKQAELLLKSFEPDDDRWDSKV
jgi:hypothetical protein